MSTRILKAAAMVAGAFFAASIHARTWSVGQGPGYDFAAIQPALDAARTGDTVTIQKGVYTRQNLVITRAINVYGFGAVIDASGTGKPAFVIVVPGGVVTLTQLEITGGSSDARGGGIQYTNFSAPGGLVLESAKVKVNAAYRGAGVSLYGSAPTTVDILRTEISGNTAAVTGGGVDVQGMTLLHMEGSSVLYNSVVNANGTGGGIAVSSARGADVFGSTVLGNRADIGAGIHSLTSGNVRLLATRVGGATRVVQNVARLQGGGIALGGSANLCGWGMDVSDNVAPDGAAIHAVSGSITLRAEQALGICGGPDAPTVNDACNLLEVCNTIADNTASGGAAVRVVGESLMDADRTLFQHNIAGSVVDSVGFLKMTNSVLVENWTTQEAIHVRNALPLLVQNCTFAHNFNQSPQLIRASGALTVSNSILWEPMKQLFRYEGPPATNPVTLNDLIVSQSPTAFAFADFVTNVQLVDPLFVSINGGDYRLQAGSPAIDASYSGEPVDFSGVPRPQSTGPSPLGRYYDIGAFESHHD